MSIKNLIKKSPIAYNCWYYIGSRLVSALKFFVTTDDKLMLFVSYGGRKYDDSPKIIYEAMLKDHRFDDYKIVWAFLRPENQLIPGTAKKIRIDSLLYYVTAMRARVWVTNVTIRRGLYFEGKNTYSINTWHGAPIKLLGADVDREKVFVGRVHTTNDFYLVQGNYESDRFASAFYVDRSHIKMTGLPRNDMLANNDDLLKDEIKKKLNIPPNKRIILYAPTFRDDEKDEHGNSIMTLHLNLDRWNDLMSKENCILLIRAHFSVGRVDGMKSFEHIKDVSRYPLTNNLLLISDILISDYSSLFFDYSILGRPMFSYTYDYDDFDGFRGMYMDIRKELHSVDNENDLLEVIEHIDIDKETAIAIAFKEKYIQEYGNATEKVLDMIDEEVN